MNIYGLDTEYFQRKFRILCRDMENYKPCELRQELIKMLKALPDEQDNLGNEEILINNTKEADVMRLHLRLKDETHLYRPDFCSNENMKKIEK